MKLPFGGVIVFAQNKPHEMERAIREFFGDQPPVPDEEELAFPLFSEWLIFDYHQSNGVDFLAEYCLYNPDNLPSLIIIQLQQAYETGRYSMFEINKVNIDQSLILEDLHSGEKFKINDKTSSSEQRQGSLTGRIGQVDGKWYFVGSDPIYFPLTHTDRMKQFLKENVADLRFTPKDTWQMIKNQSQKPKLSKALTSKELKNLRKKLESKYMKLQQKYQCIFSFSDIIEAIYKEDCGANVLDFWQDLIMDGLPEKFYFDHLQLFNDMWNTFPHRCLKDKSPIELVSQINS